MTSTIEVGLDGPHVVTRLIAGYGVVTRTLAFILLNHSACFDNYHTWI